ncbi:MULTISPECIES: hypothetical protein [Micromonospora]|uniref:Uncharacterized protein n=1 Tax=Micromonospora chalcea TaxID=1874 RepID=A0ABX9Y6G3_MICCH|nr:MULTISPECIES: hypothetical protein [Micromonospora]ODB81576.1 hypothetical protein A8711_14060 [Micromonospora sp. II]RBQ12952.1 hypothetical protein DQE82_04100 [Micromonospora sp. LHW51205]MBC8989223.1 hypothetical protein [Micromonospora chalcea]MBQ1061129.1 hypothetical protein [Micromonospora sp. C41]PPA60596.1 hypothetical protein BAW75_11755 [Micromonospora chalcea]
MTWACCSSPLNPVINPRARTFNCSKSSSVTGGRSGNRLPATAFGSAIVASYARFCRSLFSYSSCRGCSSARALPMARVAAASAS